MKMARTSTSTPLLLLVLPVIGYGTAATAAGVTATTTPPSFQCQHVIEMGLTCSEHTVRVGSLPRTRSRSLCVRARVRVREQHYVAARVDADILQC